MSTNYAISLPMRLKCWSASARFNWIDLSRSRLEKRQFLLASLAKWFFTLSPFPHLLMGVWPTLFQSWPRELMFRFRLMRWGSRPIYGGEFRRIF